jgi:hypothetical protein
MIFLPGAAVSSGNEYASKIYFGDYGAPIAIEWNYLV